jgi:hypothetical protein
MVFEAHLASGATGYPSVQGYQDSLGFADGETTQITDKTLPAERKR